jgi:hypothetical protein
MSQPGDRKAKYCEFRAMLLCAAPVSCAVAKESHGRIERF